MISDWLSSDITVGITLLNAMTSLRNILTFSPSFNRITSLYRISQPFFFHVRHPSAHYKSVKVLQLKTLLKLVHIHKIRKGGNDDLLDASIMAFHFHLSLKTQVRYSASLFNIFSLLCSQSDIDILSMLY